MNTIELEAQTAAELRDREGLTTRQIAERMKVSQPTVVRRLQLHDTGPQPALRRKRSKRNLVPLVLLAFSILILASAASALIFMRTARPVAVLPAIVCVRYAHGAVVQLTPVSRTGSCESGTKRLVITPKH